MNIPLNLLFEKTLTAPRILRRLLLATACAWSMSSLPLWADMGAKPLPALIAELQQMPPEQRDEALRRFNDALMQGSLPQREQQRQWLKQQWAALSPEQRDQLRTQVREHWQRMPPEQRQRWREERQGQRSPYGDERSREQGQDHPQHLSPDERQEFRQWMRERRDGRGGEAP